MKKLKINIEEIILDNKNPRLNNVYEIEKESLKELLEISGDKIYNLMLDISKNGLNPFDNIGVLKNKDKFIVLEGNRRICALKILNNPNIIKEIDVKLYNKMQKHKLKTKIKNLEVAVFSNREEANKWIQLVHTGENSGKGRVSWNTHNKRLFEYRNGKELSQTQKFINIFNQKSKLNNSVLNKLPNLKITNLDRLIGDPDIREAINIYKKNKQLNFENFDIEIADKLMYDMLMRNPNVSEVYTKEKRREYLEKILKNEIPEEFKLKESHENREDIYQLTDFSNKDVETNSEKMISSNDDSRKKREKSNTHTYVRKSLIPKNFVLEIEQPKINNLYLELKKCSLEEYPTLISCSFRIFLELIINEYCIKFGINLPKGKEKLEGKLTEVIERLFNEKLLRDSEKKNLIMLIRDSKSSISAQNALIHTTLSYDPNTMKNTWDNYQNLIKIIVDEINKKIKQKKKNTQQTIEYIN